MALEHTILFTVMPRGISVNGATLPVSVFVAPRLSGADNLGAFRDWLHWTRHLKQHGLDLQLHSGTHTQAWPIDRTPLRPDLWEQLFKAETLVRSHAFDDYSGRGLISFSVRQALSALKAIYQEASVSLGLPDNLQKDERSNRSRLRDLVEGLEVHWNGANANRWRAAVRSMNRSPDGALAQQALNGPLDREGLIVGQPDAAALRKVTVPFAVFHHMPTPERDDLMLDQSNVLDFHQALSALNAYPDLLRALGLVFDLDLPLDFAAQTALGAFGTLSVSKATPGWHWSVPPKTPRLETAYVHMLLGTEHFFFTAPRILHDPKAPVTVVGLLDLDPAHFGLAQVDVDGGMHKAIILAENLHPAGDRNLDPNVQPEAAQHPEVFDPGATLPALRSGGLSLFADRRALQLLDTMVQSKAFNDAVTSGGAQPRAFFAEDLIRGYRLDIWDSHTNAWHSLHLRHGTYTIGSLPFAPGTTPEEGFVQLAATQPAKGAQPATDDLYLHEAIARWAGWSLSAPMPSKHLSRYADPADAVPRDGEPDKFAEDRADTPFKMTTRYQVVPGSLPRLRVGACYRLRARAMDLAGNSLRHDEPLAALLSAAYALPRDPEGFTYLRFEPVPAPLLIVRDTRAVTAAGSAVDRIVVRTFNGDISQDTAAADTTAADRHVVPPRTSVEMGERLGMFDDASGKLKSDPATWQLIADRDAGEFNKATIEIAGKSDTYPLEPADRIDVLPHLPDPLARGAALRDLPGTPEGALGKVTPAAGAADFVAYALVNDPNPRPGSATLVSFGASGAWQQTRGFRLVLAEPAPDQDPRPHWDPAERVLTVYLAKGQTRVVPLTSYVSVDDLKLMGVWQWLRDYLERITVTDPQPQFLQPGGPADRIAHVLQRAVEGGHWMLTPPRLPTLVHALQQPLGRPTFSALNVEHEVVTWDTNPLQTAPDRGRTDPTELAPITAWRRPGATDAFLLGALLVHAASTAKLDLSASWQDPLDDPAQPTWTVNHHTAVLDELPLKTLREGYVQAPGADGRAVGYYDPEHDQIAFVRAGDWAGTKDQDRVTFNDAAPRHLFHDTRRHVVTYTAVAASRYREYFPQDQGLDFFRAGEPVVVDVPASARPLAPDVAYVVPTFGWQRQTDTNLKRSVRFGGGLRVYLHRPWFSSGEGELLGVALWTFTNGQLDAQNRDKFKPFFTQWGMDPIWQTGGLNEAPGIENLPDRVARDLDVSLEEASAHRADGTPGRIHVVGFNPEFDDERRLWYADLTVNTFSQTYMPFVRLALVRYQPHALADARVSRVVLADFAQLTPDRSALVTADPHHPRVLRVVVSGTAPRGPQAVIRAEPRPQQRSKHPTQIRVRVQERDPALASDLTWRDVTPTIASVTSSVDGPVTGQPDLVMWAGTVNFSKAPEVNRYRLLVEEEEYISADYSLTEGRIAKQPGRLIYAETFALDDALLRTT